MLGRILIYELGRSVACAYVPYTDIYHSDSLNDGVPLCLLRLQRYKPTNPLDRNRHNMRDLRRSTASGGQEKASARSILRII